MRVVAHHRDDFGAYVYDTGSQNYAAGNESDPVYSSLCIQQIVSTF
jgi:hypothetical protein